LSSLIFWDSESELRTGHGGLDKYWVWETTSSQLTKGDGGGGGGEKLWSGGSSKFTSEDNVDGMFLPATTRKKLNAKRQQMMVFIFMSTNIIFLK